MSWLAQQKPRNSSQLKFIKETYAVNIQINKIFFALMTSSRRRHYRLIDFCFRKNLEIHVSSSLLNEKKHSGFKQKKIFLFLCRNQARIINMIIGY